MKKIIGSLVLMGLVSMSAVSMSSEAEARVMKCAAGYTLSGGDGYYLCTTRIGGTIHQYDNRGNQWFVYGAE